MAKQGQIAGVGIAHRGETEYLKSIPDGSENNNLGSLPSVSPEGNAQKNRAISTEAAQHNYHITKENLRPYAVLPTF